MGISGIELRANSGLTASTEPSYQPITQDTEHKRVMTKDDGDHCTAMPTLMLFNFMLKNKGQEMWLVQGSPSI